MKNGGSTDTRSEDDNGEFAHLKTYTVPEDVTELEHGIDTHVLRHFMENHCTVDRDKGNDLATKRSVMIDAFVEWTELNDVDDKLDKLAADVNYSNRMGYMKKIFDEQLGIEPDCVWVGDEQPRCFVSIELSDDVRDLVE